MDTKYFQQAVEEFCIKTRDPMRKVQELTVGELSQLLRRAQELKDAARITEQRLQRMGE